MQNGIIKQKTKEEFLKLLQSEMAGGSITAAAKLAGWSRQTIYDWRKADEAFDIAVVEAMIDGKAELADLAEQALVKRVKLGDTTAIIFTLKNLRGEYYGEDKKLPEVEHKKDTGWVGGLGKLETPKDALLMTQMMTAYISSVAAGANLLNDDLNNMFKDLKEVFVKHNSVLR